MALNLVEKQRVLESAPDQFLDMLLGGGPRPPSASESVQYPQYLAFAEKMRRNEFRQAYAAEQAEQQMTGRTVVEDLLSGVGGAGGPQNLAGAEMMSRAQGGAPVAYQGQGVTSGAPGGPVPPQAMRGAPPQVMRGAPQGSPPGMAHGGLISGGNGVMSSGVSDDIPAFIQGSPPEPVRLSEGEFVIPADVVSGLGDGSTESGARRLRAMMENIRGAGRRSGVGPSLVPVRGFYDGGLIKGYFNGGGVKREDLQVGISKERSLTKEEIEELYGDLIDRVLGSLDSDLVTVDGSYDAIIDLISEESRGDPLALSDAGAIGMGQLKPGTFDEVAGIIGIPTGFDSMINPETNIMAAVSYLDQNFNLSKARYEGLSDKKHLENALSFYNAGPNYHLKKDKQGNPTQKALEVEKWNVEGGDHPIEATDRYVKHISGAAESGGRRPPSWDRSDDSSGIASVDAGDGVPESLKDRMERAQQAQSGPLEAMLRFQAERGLPTTPGGIAGEDTRVAVPRRDIFGPVAMGLAPGPEVPADPLTGWAQIFRGDDPSQPAGRFEKFLNIFAGPGSGDDASIESRVAAMRPAFQGEGFDPLGALPSVQNWVPYASLAAEPESVRAERAKQPITEKDLDTTTGFVKAMEDMLRTPLDPRAFPFPFPLEYESAPSEWVDPEMERRERLFRQNPASAVEPYPNAPILELASPRHKSLDQLYRIIGSDISTPEEKAEASRILESKIARVEGPIQATAMEHRKALGRHDRNRRVREFEERQGVEKRSDLEAALSAHGIDPGLGTPVMDRPDRSPKTGDVPTPSYPADSAAQDDRATRAARARRLVGISSPEDDDLLGSRRKVGPEGFRREGLTGFDLAGIGAKIASTPGPFSQAIAEGLKETGRIGAEKEKEGRRYGYDMDLLTAREGLYLDRVERRVVDQAKMKAVTYVNSANGKEHIDKLMFLERQRPESEQRSRDQVRAALLAERLEENIRTMTSQQQTGFLTDREFVNEGSPLGLGS